VGTLWRGAAHDALALAAAKTPVKNGEFSKSAGAEFLGCLVWLVGSPAAGAARLLACLEE